jgi:hypothetical protein
MNQKVISYVSVLEERAKGRRLVLENFNVEKDKE